MEPRSARTRHWRSHEFSWVVCLTLSSRFIQRGFSDEAEQRNASINWINSHQAKSELSHCRSVPPDSTQLKCFSCSALRTAMISSWFSQSDWPDHQRAESMKREITHFRIAPCDQPFAELATCKLSEWWNALRSLIWLFGRSLIRLWISLWIPLFGSSGSLLFGHND